jgi:nucleoside-diphosphate-sugar epimerase
VSHGTALVVGATGIVGRGLAQQLVAADWRVLCASRSGGSPVEGAQAVRVDLLDAADCGRAFAAHPGVTHLFYAAYVQAANRAAEIEPNVAMLRNAVQAVQSASPGLEKVVLVTGAKYYGIQWGASATPCRETDARQLPPNFYYDQEDWLRDASRDANWRWVNLIPPFVSGYAVGNPMNLVLGVGLYAAVCKELGMPLRFPGSLAAYDAIHQIADAAQIGAAARWAANSGNAANEAFNVTNGDPVRWRQTWPAIARALGMEAAEPKTVPLADMMPHLQHVWDRIAARHGLERIDLARIVNWTWMDYMLRQGHDIVLATAKIRNAGFHDCIDTADVFIGRLRQLRDERILPP